MKEGQTGALRRRSRLLRNATLAVLAVLILASAIDVASLVRGPTREQLSLIIFFRASMLFYLAAIVMAAHAFHKLARGAFFDRTLVSLLRRAGGCVFVGALVQVFGAPLLMNLVRGSGGTIGNFDPSAITLGVLGLMLVAVGRLFDAAAEMRAELDEIL